MSGRFASLISSRASLFLALPLAAAAAGCAGEGASPIVEDRAATPMLSRAAADSALAPAAATSAAAERARPPRPPLDPLLKLARGRWLGTCDILLTGRTEPAVTIEIERITEPTGTPGEMTWTLIYRDANGEQVRPYIMRADPAVPGRYLLDEQNGIVLTSYLQGPNLLSSDFDVPGVRLHTARSSTATATSSRSASARSPPSWSTISATTSSSTPTARSTRRSASCARCAAPEIRA